MSELWIPGPVPVSEAVRAAYAISPPSHLAAGFKAQFASALRAMRTVWSAPTGQPFVVAGTGTLAMEATAVNLCEPGTRALVVNVGIFGSRMAEMLRRRGAVVTEVGSAPGADVDLHAVDTALRGQEVLFATHVDTSTGARVDAESLCRLARKHGALSAFDGVCATGAEWFEMEDWGADVVFTASQKALGLPAGLALWMCSEAALARRSSLSQPPPMVLDWQSWLPIMQAYEHEQNAYFGTPPTTLIPALAVSLADLLNEGMPAVFARHARVASQMRTAFAAANLLPVAQTPANTLSALRWPEGVGPEALAHIAARGVVVAGGLHPDLKTSTFRVGHLGTAIRDAAAVERAIAAVIDGIDTARRV